MPVFDVNDYRISGPVSRDRAFDIMGTARAARLFAEDVRESHLSRRVVLPDGANRPMAVLAENLAVAAWRVETTKLDDPASPYLSEFPYAREKYNAALEAFFDALALAEQEHWSMIRAKYGNVSRDATPRLAKGCTGVFALVASAVLTRLIAS